MNLLTDFLTAVPLLSRGWIVPVGGSTPDRQKPAQNPNLNLNLSFVRKSAIIPFTHFPQPAVFSQKGIRAQQWQFNKIRSPPRGGGCGARITGRRNPPCPWIRCPATGTVAITSRATADFTATAASFPAPTRTPTLKTTNNIRVALDAMSGEAGPPPAVAAARRFVADNPQAEIILVGKTGELRKFFNSDSEPSRVSFCDAAGVVQMSEPPAGAIRKRDSSMRRALELVASGEADAMVSAGNTGALLGLGVLTLRLVVGAARPAIASFVPNLRKPGDFSCMLDLGANVECDPEMLRQFAVMGAALARTVKGVSKPSVKLLNIGEEQFKGRDELKDAAAELDKESGIDFAGNMEGYDIYRGAADVIVCDGFTGNVALKVSEGLAAMLSRKISGAFREGPLAVACGVAAWPVLRKLREEMDHRKYNGAFLLGLRGLVVKSHGNADADAFLAAIQFAAQAGNKDLAGNIARALETSAAEDENGKGEGEGEREGEGR